jgi:hypothetical protein
LSALRQTTHRSHYTAGIIRRMASRNNVTAVISSGDRWAQDVTRLSGDDVTFDDVEQLVVALQRAGVLSRVQAVKLQARYLRENRP